MKPRNFPLRRLLRQARAQGFEPTQAEVDAARAVRTKKYRGSR